MVSQHRIIGMGVGLLALAIGAGTALGQEGQKPVLIRSAQSGAWSSPATWAGGKVPSAGNQVQIRAGHSIRYDVQSDQVIRSLHIAGTLSFATDKDTRLDVGLIKIQAGDSVDEEGFDCDGHQPATDPDKPKAALLVGTANEPIAADHSALIRLTYVEGMKKESCPAIVCCGGRMDFHGAPMNRTWVKLGSVAKEGAKEVLLAEAVTGWRVGDRIILTATTRQNKGKKTFRTSVRDSSQTEERIIRAIDGTKVTLDKPLQFEHVCDGAYRGEVANLSRNIVVESADPKGVRGHTMYHRNSTGSIGHAEFRHLGKDGVLGRYSLHYHLVGDTMRGSSVIGASIWDSHNRWLTIHGTNYLVVRDCVGYQSKGHGFFLEDGTEVYNVLDRNLAVQAYETKPLPKQVLPFDKNDGAGFWWANCLNSFTRNTACDCDEYGYFFQAVKNAEFDPLLSIQQPDGSRKRVDIRTLPFVRFEDNETHCQRRHGFNLGGLAPFGDGIAGVGPDERHPLVIRNLRAWNVHWAIHPVSPAVLIDRMDILNADYGVWRPIYRQHAYRGITMDQVPDQTRYAFVNPAGPPSKETDFPKPLDPVDDLPPITIITHVGPLNDGKLTVRGTTSDNGAVKKVVVNGIEARSVTANFAEWEVTLEGLRPGAIQLSAHAEDAAGNVESRKHQVTVDAR